MLNPEFKAKWVEALESGKYSQTSGVLFDGDHYCCLGVACEVKGARWEPWVDNGIDYDVKPIVNGTVLSTLHDELLNKSFLDEIGLTEEQQMQLTTMNDEGVSFKSIANYIKKHL